MPGDPSVMPVSGGSDGDGGVGDGSDDDEGKGAVE